MVFGLFQMLLPDQSRTKKSETVTQLIVMRQSEITIPLRDSHCQVNDHERYTCLTPHVARAPMRPLKAPLSGGTVEPWTQLGAGHWSAMRGRI